MPYVLYYGFSEPKINVIECKMGYLNKKNHAYI